jgi:hypothetical protein
VLYECISSVMKIQSAVKCHGYLTQKQHTTVMQPAGAKTTQGTMTSHYFGQKRKLGIYFRVKYHYHLKEGMKPKYSEKTPDDLFIRHLIPV